MKQQTMMTLFVMALMLLASMPVADATVNEAVPTTCSYKDRNTDSVSCTFACEGKGTVHVNAGVNDNVSFTASAACSDGTADCGGTRDDNDCPQEKDVGVISEGVCSFNADEFWDSGGYVTCSWNSAAEEPEPPECTWVVEQEIVCTTEYDDGKTCTYVVDQEVVCTGESGIHQEFIHAWKDARDEWQAIACGSEGCTIQDWL